MQIPDMHQETATFVEGLALGQDHVYFAKPEARMRTGIWRSQAYSEYYDSYAADEFMYVIEGSVTLEAEGFAQTYRAGEAFFVPKGFCGFWRQTEPMVKFYVIVE